MAKKYLDYDGLAYFWEKVKNRIIGKIDDVNYDNTNKKLTKTKEGVTTDIVSVATLKTDMALKKADVGLANVVDGAQVNVLQGIQKNGTTVSITNKIANITVPTKTSDITNDSGFITIADVPEGAAASTTTPKMNGTAAVGTQAAFARGDHVHPVDTSRAPTNHASTATTYGSGSSTNYGHVKLSDATNGTAAAASGGTAASPKAVADALKAAKDYADSLDTGVTGVKGNAETTYRTGDVNLTPANIGAAPTSHASTATTYGVGTTANYGHVKVTNGNGLNISSGTISMSVASTTAAGAMSAADKTKLDGAAPLASPALTGTPTAPTAAAATDNTQIATTAFVHDVVDALDDFTGATSDAAGTHGLVPAPKSGDNNKILTGNGEWNSIGLGLYTERIGNVDYNGFSLILEGDGEEVPTNLGHIVYPRVTQSSDGMMRKEDKIKIDGAAPLASPALTGTPTAPTATAGTNNTQIATTAFVTSAIQTAQTGAASFQGTAPTTFAPTNYKKGYYWVVGTAGTYAGETCEPGDMIFAVADYVSSYKAADFNVIQTNLDITSITNAEIDTICAA